MNEYDWATTRDQAIELYGETPGAQLEQDIIGHFVDDPERVIRTIHRVAEQKDIRSRWAVVRADLTRAAQADIKVDNTRSRSKAADRARAWIDNAGIHYDRPEHVEAELFGDEYGRGILADHATDQRLRDELMAYWREQRPRGEQAERDFEAYNARCRAYHEARMAAQREAREKARAQLEDREYADPDTFTGTVTIDGEPALVTAADQDIDFG